MVVGARIETGEMSGTGAMVSGIRTVGLWEQRRRFEGRDSDGGQGWELDVRGGGKWEVAGT